MNKKEAVELLKGKLVLLVEDNDINQELFRELLMMNGVEVETAGNGAEAIQMLSEKNFDAVLMDCQMPVMDGYEATRQIRQQKKHQTLPIVALTGNTSKIDVDKALDAGMNDHISKPFSVESLLSILASRIAGE